MFHNYRLPERLCLSQASNFWQKHPGYHRAPTKIDGKNYICDFIPLQIPDIHRFYLFLNSSLSVLSSKQKTNIPLVPISFWTIVSVGDPTPAHLLLFTENNDGKLSIDEIEKPPAQKPSPIPTGLTPLDKSKIIYCVHKVYEHVLNVENIGCGYLHLTNHCVFLNGNKEPSLGYYGLHLLKDFIVPECYSRFFGDEQLNLDPVRIPPLVRSYGAIHWHLETLLDNPIPFEQSVFFNSIKRTPYFNGPQPPNGASIFISQCFELKNKVSLLYKGVKPKDFVPIAQEINRNYDSPRSADETAIYRISYSPESSSRNNIFSKFLNSFVIPYPDDPFRDVVREQLQQHLSFISTRYEVDYSFSGHNAKRGPHVFENQAFQASNGLTKINQEFVNKLKKAALLGSLDALYYLSHFALMQYEGDAPEEIVNILKTAADFGNVYAAFEYGLYIATTIYLERYTPNGQPQSDLVKDAITYFETAAKKKPFAYVFIAFFCYLCNDNSRALKLLLKIEKTIPALGRAIKYIQPSQEGAAPAAQ